MAINAKFKISRLTPMPWATQDEPTVEVEMTPDYAGDRNKDWQKYTPTGVIRLTVNNPAAIDEFQVGKAFTVTFDATE